MDKQSAKGIMVTREEGGSIEAKRYRWFLKCIDDIESNITCYDPSVVAIGQFHHGEVQGATDISDFPYLKISYYLKSCCSLNTSSYNHRLFNQVGVTSYVSFMDSLIDHAEDVKELRSKGILLNFLGSDQEVADLFNETARDLVPDPHAFVDVRNKIENHYNNKVKIWITGWMYSHFSTPWSTLAFIAANFVIGFAID
ncbi:hypothetical protein FXO38_04731 [Capsicum annuum]|nr:hypothetical protein FXO37_25563 [Capsicum annuum]KAF3675446.1 hypothetical protein FXO38_04731 [Capsicum annuum]